jgi:pilus assembly protein CpaB
VRRYLDPGAPVTAADVLRVRDRGFLAAVLEPGTRAASIGVDEVSGVSGLIWPGDRVDVILTQNMDKASSVGMRVVSEAVLQDARVIAVDQDIARAAQTQGPTTSVGHIARTVTLQISPKDSDRLAVARQLGHLSLAVRAMSDGFTETLAGSTTYSKDVTSVLTDPTGKTVRVIQGEQHNDVTFR